MGLSDAGSEVRSNVILGAHGYQFISNPISLLHAKTYCPPAFWGGCVGQPGQLVNRSLGLPGCLDLRNRKEHRISQTSAMLSEG